MNHEDLGGISHRSGGVRHPPEADIESIRDLLRGYESSHGILKELAQNAEDAGSSRMDILYVPGDQASPHDLLKGPGLLVANDGRFTEEHRDAITQISLGTKATEDRAIGRFGKGLKSVFAWCEAFFIVARTDPNLGWSAPHIADLFNPWSGWRHRDWDEQLEASSQMLIATLEQYLGSAYPEAKPWLALWFPLRRRERHISSDESIFPLFPGEDDLAGFFGTWRNLQLAQEGQITDRFTKAIEQLGAVNPDGTTPKLDVRSGGIYALERIANDSERDHWPMGRFLRWRWLSGLLSNACLHCWHCRRCQRGPSSAAAL